MTTVRCKTCSKTFTKASPVQAAAALRMHVGRLHTGLIPTANKGRSRVAPGAVVRSTPVVDGRKRPVLIEAETQPACYCPRCGLNLLVLNTAMHVASKMSPA